MNETKQEETIQKADPPAEPEIDGRELGQFLGMLESAAAPYIANTKDGYCQVMVPSWTNEFVTAEFKLIDSRWVFSRFFTSNPPKERGIG